MHWIVSLVASLQANCSTHVVQRQKNSCRQTCCVCVVRNMSCHWQNEDFVDHVRRWVECWQPGTPHRCLTIQRLMHEAGDLGTRLVGEQSASATDLTPAWCGRVFWHQWQVLQRFARTGPSGEVRQTRRTEVNYNSPADLIWTRG